MIVLLVTPSALHSSSVRSLRPALRMVQSWFQSVEPPAAADPCLIKSVLAKSECHACSVTTRTPSRCVGSAPAKPSKTYRPSCLLRCLVAICSQSANCSGVMGWLTLPHQILSWIPGVSSRYLSLGQRPVKVPVLQTRAPLEASVPSPRLIASSINSAGDRFNEVRLADRSNFSIAPIDTFSPPPTGPGSPPEPLYAMPEEDTRPLPADRPIQSGHH